MAAPLSYANNNQDSNIVFKERDIYAENVIPYIKNRISRKLSLTDFWLDKPYYGIINTDLFVVLPKKESLSLFNNKY